MRPVELARRLDRLAREDPLAEAIVAGGHRISRADLEARAARLGWYFAHRGVEPGTRVAVTASNRPELVEALYAGWKCDAAIVPVGVTARVDAAHDSIDRSDAKVVVCDEDRADTVAAAVKRIPKRWRPDVLVIGPAYERELAAAPPDVESLTQDAEGADPPAPLAAEALLARELVVLPALPIVSGSGFRTVVDALGAGATLVLVPGRGIAPTALWEVVAAEQVRVLVIPGDAFALPLAAALETLETEASLDALAKIVSPGAAIGDDARAALERRLPRVRIEAPVTDPSAPSAEDRRRAQVVEQVLGKHRSVAALVAVPLRDAGAGKVVAIVEVTERHYLDEAELVAWSRSRLRGEDMPDAFVVLERLPRTEDGMLDGAAVERTARARISSR